MAKDMQVSYQWNSTNREVSDKYLIVTSGGVRMQAGNNSITVTGSSTRLNYNDQYIISTGSGGCVYSNDGGKNWISIGYSVWG